MRGKEATYTMLISSPAFNPSDLNDRRVGVGRKGEGKSSVAMLKDEKELEKRKRIIRKFIEKRKIKESTIFFIFLSTLFHEIIILFQEIAIDFHFML